MLVLCARRCRCTCLDAGHAHDGELLAMALAPTVVFAPLLLEHENLLRLLVADDLARHLDTVEERLADLQPRVRRRQQHVGEDEGRARLGGQLLETDRLAGMYPI